MPGKVVSVLVSAGQTVEAGATLLVLEAMKMEHTIAAPGDVLGVVLTTVALLPGASTVVELRVEPSGDPPYAFVAEVDRAADESEVVAECDEEDNLAAIDGVDCEVLF